MKKSYNKFEKMYMGAGKSGGSKKTSKALPLSSITGNGEDTRTFNKNSSVPVRERNNARKKRF